MSAPAEASLGLRRERLTAAAVIWLAAQLLVAAVSLDDAGAPAVLGLAAATGAALNAALLWPLRSGRSRTSLPSATAVVVLVGAVALTTALLVPPSPMTSTTTWFPGLLCPVVALLAVRGRPLHAAAAAAAVLGAVVVAGAVHPATAWAPVVLVLVVPVVLWLGGGVALGRILRTTRLDLLRSDNAFALARDRRERTRVRTEARDRRRALLEFAAVPLLQVVAASDGPQPAHVRAQLRTVEADLRAELRGRDLLDASVRHAVARARARGVRVDVVDHAPPGADAAALLRLRALVTAAVRAAADGELTARRPPHGRVLTLVHLGSPTSLDAVVGAVRSHAGALRGLGVAVSRDEDSVVVEIDR